MITSTRINTDLLEANLTLINGITLSFIAIKINIPLTQTVIFKIKASNYGLFALNLSQISFY